MNEDSGLAAEQINAIYIEAIMRRPLSIDTPEGREARAKIEASIAEMRANGVTFFDVPPEMP